MGRQAGVPSTERGVELIALSQDALSHDPSPVRVVLRHPDGRIEQAAAPWLISAEGADPATVDSLAPPGRKLLLLTGFATEVVVLHAAHSAIKAGYHVYYVPVDACGGMSSRTEEAAFRKIEAAGGITTSVVGFGDSARTGFQPVAREGSVRHTAISKARLTLQANNARDQDPNFQRKCVSKLAALRRSSGQVGRKPRSPSELGAPRMNPTSGNRVQRVKIGTRFGCGSHAQAHC